MSYESGLPSEFIKRINVLLLDGLADAGLDTDAVPDSARGMISVEAMNSAVAALRERTDNLLEANQKERLQAITGPGWALETVWFLDETLPDFGVLDALREELKVAFSAHGDAIKIQVQAMVNEAAKAAGIRELPANAQFETDMRALNQAWTGLLERTDSLLSDAQREQVQRLKSEGEPHDIVRLLDEALPDYGVLDALRAELEAAYTRAVADEMVAEVEQMSGETLSDAYAHEGGETEAAEPQSQRRGGPKRSWFRRRGGRG